MNLYKTVGSVVAAHKDSGLSGIKLLLVRQIDVETFDTVGPVMIAADAAGAGYGCIVMCVSGCNASKVANYKDRPVDLAIVGILDSVEYEGKTVYSQS